MATNNIGRAVIPFTIINNSGSSQPLYLYMFGTADPKKPANNQYYLSNLQGDCERFLPNEAHKSYGLPLEGLKVEAFFPQLDGGRIYISVGNPLLVATNKDGFPDAVSADNPPPGNVNYDTIWDFVEATWHDYGDRTILNVNTTQVDAFGLAFKIEHSGFDPSNPQSPLTIVNGFDSDTARKNIFRDLERAGTPWNQLIIRSSTAPPRPVRALMPLKAIDQGSFPQDQLGAYIKAVLEFYLNTTSNRLNFTYSGVNYVGQTSMGGFLFKPDKAKDDGGRETFEYKIPTPTTRQVYANSIASSRDDGPGGAICAALGASFCRSTLTFYPNAGFPVPQNDRSLYYNNQPIFEYARIIHSYGIDNHAFCYGYDEVAGDAGGNRDVRNPTSLTLTIKGVGIMDDKLYVVNYGLTGDLTKYVGPKDRDKNPAHQVTVGPQSFATVTTQEVNGPPPWQVTQNPTGPYLTATNVESLPAVIAFDPGHLTAIAY